jgi:hypothetical protein
MVPFTAMPSVRITAVVLCLLGFEPGWTATGAEPPRKLPTVDPTAAPETSPRPSRAANRWASPIGIGSSVARSLSTYQPAVAQPLATTSLGDPLTFALVQGSDCAPPVAACVRPLPAVIANAACEWHWPAAETGPVTIQVALQKWSTASEDRSPANQPRVLWLQRQYPQLTSAHLTELTAELMGPVSLECLQDTFEWSFAVDQPRGTISLRAIPHDETVRLFCSELAVTLDEERFQLTELTVKAPQTDWVHITPWQPSPINAAVASTVSDFADGVPPSPALDALSPAIRFIGETIELNSRSRR